MKPKIRFQNPIFSAPSFLAVLLLSAFALAFLAYAFDQASAGLDPSQRTIVNFLCALLAGGAGFFYGGVLLTAVATPTRGVRITVRAVAGSALFLVVLLCPPGAIGWRAGQEALATHPGEMLQILTPVPGSEVGVRVTIRAHTPRPEWRHYLAVAPESGGGETLQQGAVAVSSTGEVSGTVTIGTASAGIGERFLIRVIASRFAIEPGPLPARREILRSIPVLVTRSMF
ncbi:MAG: hypothetical protein IT168_01515 [Bryobacterales bacterium]|nr:hypothetical protein [Bryobacterales bacterium]